MSLALAASLGGLPGCRACDDGTSEGPPPTGSYAAGPTMPTGMLVPGAGGVDRRESTDGAGAGAGAGTGARTHGAAPADVMPVARGVKAGAWAELQLARGGDTADRKAFEHWRDDSQFVSLEAMTQLHDPFARALPGFDLFLPRLYDPAALAKLATELDAFAQRSSGPIATTARELAALARDASAKSVGLWVVPPP